MNRINRFGYWLSYTHLAFGPRCDSVIKWYWLVTQHASLAHTARVSSISFKFYYRVNKPVNWSWLAFRWGGLDNKVCSWGSLRSGESQTFNGLHPIQFSTGWRKGSKYTAASMNGMMPPLIPRLFLCDSDAVLDNKLVYLGCKSPLLRKCGEKSKVRKF